MPAVNSITLARLLSAQRSLNKQQFSVESSCINDLYYDPEEESMTIEFQKRGTYKYYDVPLDEYVDLAQSSSLGTYFNLYVRNKGYQYERIG